MYAYPLNAAWEVGSAPKIHVDLEESIHQKLRVKVALANETIQEYISRLVAENVRGIRVQDGKRRSKE